MAVLDLAIDYIIKNWVNILFAIALSSFFFLLSSRGIKKVIVSRQEERQKIAKESIVDVLENQIINNSDMDNDKIIHLLNATSRERGVNLIKEYTTLDILEDLELRFAKSKHLKNEQREEYIKKLEVLLRRLEEEKTTILPYYETVLTNLEESIKKGDNESIKSNLSFLRSKLILETEKKKEPEMFANYIGALIAIIVLMITIGTTLFESTITQYPLILPTILVLVVSTYIIFKKRM